MKHSGSIKYINTSFVVLCIVVILVTLVKYLNDPFLTYDESGQFFMGLGLNHFTPPFSEPGNLSDVIHNNSHYNLDPGGFTVLAFFWQKISTHWVFLHLLPVLFFFGFAIYLYRIANEELNNRYLALFLATISFILPVFTNRVAEYRAYSMEMMGTFMSIWLLYKFQKETSYKLLILLSLAQVLFCTSRYGYIIVAFCVSLRVLYLLYKNETVKLFIIKGLLYSIPVLVSVIVVYFISMKTQNATIGGSVPYSDYILTSPKSLLSLLSLLFYLTIIVYIVRKKQHGSISEFHLMACIVAGVFFFLSVLGKYPWDQHRTISAFSVLFFFVAIIVLRIIQKKVGERSVYVAVVGLIATFAFFLLFFNKIHLNNTETIVLQHSQQVKENQTEKISLSSHSIPILKFQYEYASLKDKQAEYGYPQDFIFEKVRGKVWEE